MALDETAYVRIRVRKTFFLSFSKKDVILKYEKVANFFQNGQKADISGLLRKNHQITSINWTNMIHMASYQPYRPRRAIQCTYITSSAYFSCWLIPELENRLKAASKRPNFGSKLAKNGRFWPHFSSFRVENGRKFYGSGTPEYENCTRVVPYDSG